DLQVSRIQNTEKITKVGRHRRLNPGSSEYESKRQANFLATEYLGRKMQMTERTKPKKCCPRDP
ncbi:hypothetical protein L9F63_009209, partial [Diploptera punctata]